MQEFASPTPKPVNISAWLQYYSFDCLGVLCFSQPIGCLSTGTDVGCMIGAVDGIFDYVSLVSELYAYPGVLTFNFEGWPDAIPRQAALRKPFAALV